MILLFFMMIFLSGTAMAHKVNLFVMPEMDGITFVKKAREILPDVPVVMITAAKENPSLKLDALSAGATDFLNKPLDLAEFKARVSNLSSLSHSQKLLKNKALHLEEEVKAATTEIMDREYESLRVIGKAAEFKDTETGNHVKRVAHYSRILAEGMGLSKEEQDIIFYAAPLHDIGKIGIEDSVLLKPDRLDATEFARMKLHTSIGATILKGSKSKYLDAGSMVALSHHEKYDGTGYPKGLAGKDIPLYGRIVAVADVFDALLSKRPYKAAWHIDDAVQTILSESGTHFDPEIVDVFSKQLAQIKAISEEFKD
jgi:response regulator RpfG family c-di-GMP phosphodiesterase